MKKLISILIFVIFSSISFAEETPTNWKWEKAFNSIVLVSSERTPDDIIKEGVPKDFFEDNEKQTPDFIPIVPKLPEYGMGTGFFINKVHIVTNYHVIRNFDTIKIYSYNHPFEITDVKVIGYDADVDIAVL